MVFGKLLAKREKREKEEEDAPAPVIRGFSAKEVWDLRLRLHEASREIDQQGWTQRFKLADRKGEGHLSFDDFRRAVRSANIKSSVISDFDLEHVVTIVDADNSGKIDLDEFLTFLRPEFIPDVRATASSWLGQGRGPMNAVNGIGTMMNDIGVLCHTGNLDGNAWCSEDGVDGDDTWILFELPRVYFVNQINFWNYMSWESTKEQDCRDALSAFEISCSLNGRCWYHVGRVEGLPEIPTTGISNYTGELIQNKSMGGKKGMHKAHRKAGLIQLDESLGLPVRFLRLHNLENRGGSRFGINGVLFYGPPAVGDYVRRGARLQALPTEVFGQFQYVVGLDIGHNMIAKLPDELERLVLCERLCVAYNVLEEFPPVLTRGDFPQSLRVLDLSHNFLKVLPPEVGELAALEELHVAGHFWHPAGLPPELCQLKQLRALNLMGLPTITEWLLDSDALSRHSLDTAPDRSIVLEPQFLAYVQEHPLLLRSLGVHGARAMFHRHDSRKEIVVGREYVPSLDLHEASELDGMLQQLFAQDYVPIPDDLWDMPALVDLRLRRSGIERGGQRLPASGFAEKISGAVGLGVFTLLPEQASFKGAIQLELPSVAGVVEEEKKERAMEARGWLDRPQQHFHAEATRAEQEAVMREDRRLLRPETNPPLPHEEPLRYVDYRGQLQTSGPETHRWTYPLFEFGGR